MKIADGEERHLGRGYLKRGSTQMKAIAIKHLDKDQIFFGLFSSKFRMRDSASEEETSMFLAKLTDDLFTVRALGHCSSNASTEIDNT